MIDCRTGNGKIHMRRAMGTTLELVADINIIVASLYNKIRETSEEQAKIFKLAYLQSTVFFAKNADDFDFASKGSEAEEDGEGHDSGYDSDLEKKYEF